MAIGSSSSTQRVLGFGFRILDFGVLRCCFWVQGLGFLVLAFGFRVWGLGFGLQGFRLSEFMRTLSLSSEWNWAPKDHSVHALAGSDSAIVVQIDPVSYVTPNPQKIITL